jgi:catechol 2,3-dioxygenase-like lactoylglutathione lyase family enzyme
MSFQPRLSVITIAARDVGAMRTFYVNVLGWTPVAENADIVFFRLNGFLLSLCNREALGKFLGIDMVVPGTPSVTFGYNVHARDEVLDLYARLKDRVRIIRPPTEPPFGGLFFYFADIEDNIFEVAWNPYVGLAGDGNVESHLPIDDL